MRTSILPTLALAPALVLSVGLGPSAHAASATAALDNFTITVTDLNPADGITAGYSFDGSYREVYEGSGSSLFQEIGDGRASYSPYTVGASATSVGSSALQLSYLSPQAALLTPYTELTITADAVVTRSAAAGESADASASVSLFGFRGGSQISFGDLALRLDDTATAGTLSAPFRLSFRTGAEGLLFSYSTEVFGRAMAPPVPEPQTYALMLAGLAGVGWAARRRRAQAGSVTAGSA